VLQHLVQKISIFLHSTRDPFLHNAWLAYGNNIGLIGAILSIMLLNFCTQPPWLFCLEACFGTLAPTCNYQIGKLEIFYGFKTLVCKILFHYRSEKEQDLFNAIGSMYAAVILIGVKNGNSVQPVVGVERTVFYRERPAGMYSAFPYAFAQASISQPNHL